MSLMTSAKNLLSKINGVLHLERAWFRKLIKAIWILFFVFVVGMPLYIYAVIQNPFDLFGGMPGLQALENPENDLSSEVISADGVSLGRYFRYNNRSQVSYAQLPPMIVNTLLISEDHRFYKHSGLDAQSFLRVIWGMVRFDSQGGGSTLTQQTAKNLFNTREEELQGKLAKLGSPFKLLISKTKEWIIAVRLERNLTKEEIIALYLNTVPFNNNAYGIKIAALTYFNKPLSQLNIQESALLIGMLQGTYRFNPVQHPERARNKRNDVLNKLFAHQYIKDERVLDSLKALPLELKLSIQSHNQGMATYFRSVLQNVMMNWCNANGYDLYESGLKIYTTLDSRMQRFAEEAMEVQMKKLQGEFDHAWGNRNPWVDEQGNELTGFLQRKMKTTDTYQSLVKHYGANNDSVSVLLNLKKPMHIFTWSGERDTLMSSYDSLRHYNRFLQSGLLSMNPVTGEVKAWVGGINHQYFKYDHVHQSKRQPGSTFKTFVYGKAMEDGYSPCQPFNDISPTIMVNGSVYHPANSNGGYGDGNAYTLRQALAKSLNSITIQLMERLNPQNVSDFATRIGIKSKLDAVYSLGLGTSVVSLEELVAAYCGFANLGVYTEPYYLVRIEDRNGNVVANFVPHTKQAMSQETADKTLYLLKGVLEEEGGTAKNLISEEVMKDNDVGGKTGTTDNASDGWYVGVTHNLVTGIWVGGDEPSIHFPSWKFGSGAHTALPAWNAYMRKVYRYSEIGYGKGYFKHADVRTYHECDDADSTDEF